MSKITCEIKLDQFFLKKQNDAGGKDEPYLFAIYGRIDGGVLESTVPPQDRIVPITFPANLGHGNLGPDSKGMSLTGRSIVNVPSDVGHWTTTLDSKNMNMSASVMRNCSIAVGLVFMEEDSTLDSSIVAAVAELKPEVRKTANGVLRIFLGVMPEIPANFPARAQILAALEAYRQDLLEGGIDPNGIVNGSSLIDKVLDKVLPKEIGKAVGKAFIPGGELINIIAGIVQASDPDEYIGANGGSFSFYNLVGRNHAATKFDYESLQYTTLPVPGLEPQTIRVTSKGVYAVDGTVRRTDTDEVPIMAAMRGPGEKVTILARRLDGGFFERKNSNDFGSTFSLVSGGTFATGLFKSGPGAASGEGGAKQCVAGLGLDDEIYFNFSLNGGGIWGGWTRISQRKTFRSGPAVAMSEDGDTVYVVAREQNNTYWFTQSANRGGTWQPWKQIGSGVFHSSPAIVRVAGPTRGRETEDALVVAGLGTNNHVYTTKFAASAGLTGQDWNPIGVGSEDHATAGFTSAPAMVSDGKQKVLLMCRAKNLLYYRVDSFNGGQSFKVGTVWLPIGRPDLGKLKYPDGERVGDLQDMYSAPALVARDDMEIYLVLGLSPTLSVWRNKATRSEPARWKALNPEPENDLRVHYY